MFEPWMLAMLEEEGLVDTSDGLINRVAKVLAKTADENFDVEEFYDACTMCNVDPDSFTQEELIELKKKIGKLRRCTS